MTYKKYANAFDQAIGVVDGRSAPERVPDPTMDEVLESIREKPSKIDGIPEVVNSAEPLVMAIPAMLCELQVFEGKVKSALEVAHKEGLDNDFCIEIQKLLIMTQDCIKATERLEELVELGHLDYCD